jgi:modulator of FtsH protease
MPGQWINFVIAAAGASAALAGLVIVAISVNIAKIISYPHLPARAGATIGTLILILVVSMAALVPQGLSLLGIEIIVFGICCWLLQLRAANQMLIVRRERNRPWYESIRGILLGQIQTLPVIIGGILLFIHDPNGFFWIAGGVIAIFIFSMYNAWVLLVEILR